jgi:hypothetical protein
MNGIKYGIKRLVQKLNGIRASTIIFIKLLRNVQYFLILAPLIFLYCRLNYNKECFVRCLLFVII